MDWVDAILDEREDEAHWGYRLGSSPATEPTALAALALTKRREAAADRARQWLLRAQTADGSLGINVGSHAPHWATSLAVLAWRSAGAVGTSSAEPFEKPIEQAVKWMLSVGGTTSAHDPDLGHDTSLRGWPWVEGTHSWIEPTAWCLLALKATGHAGHHRASEAVRLLVDRMLPEGGCNYGNTSVLGQTLRPHLDPTGVALLALAGEDDTTGKIARTLDWTAQNVGPETTALSLAMGVLGLTAHRRRPPQAAAWLAQVAARRALPSALLPWRTLLVLAALGVECPLISLARTGNA